MPKAEDGMEAQGGAPQGGQPQGDPMQEIMQMAQQMAQEGAEPMQIVQALMEQGVPPEAIGQVLVQLGMPEEQVQQVMQEIMQGQPQGEPQQEGQPMMEDGGVAPPDGEGLYNLEERPGYTFMYNKKAGWMMLDDNLGNEWQPIHDPTGDWAKKLDKNAVLKPYQGGPGSSATGVSRQGFKKERQLKNENNG